MFSVWIRTLQLSVKSLWMHPLRSSLTVLGIFIGVSSVIWLLAIGEGIGRAAQEQISSLGALNIIVRTIKPSSDEVQDAGYGLTRDDYVRLLATLPTIEKAIPMRHADDRVPQPNRMMEGRLVGSTPDYAEVTRLVVDRGRFLSDADMTTNATTACWRRKWPMQVISIWRADRPEDDDRRRILRSGRRDEAAGGVGRHRRLAGRGEFFQRHLCAHHHALAARGRHDRDRSSRASFSATSTKSRRSRSK